VALRSGHGKGAGRPRVEVLPADELPDGIPEEAGDGGLDEPEHDARGRFKAGNTVSAKGGRRKAGAIKLARRLGLDEIASEAFAPYRSAAEAFRRHEVNRLAATVGAGYCGAGPASIVATAAMQRAASAYLSDVAGKTDDADLFIKASKLGNDSRQNLLAAHELCAREAKAREDSEGDDLARQQLEFQRQLKAGKGGSE
jgi:hypothetical protein